MIHASRFIATSDDREAWLAARRPAVTATEVSKASTSSGFTESVDARRNPVEIIQNHYMRFGSDNENWIALHLKAEFGIMPNHWLIAAADNPLFMATPDGLSLDHTFIAEIKTGGKVPAKPPLPHVRQVNWQFRCTDTERCVYAFMPRIEVNGMFMPGLLEPLTWWIDRDDALIAELEETAYRLLDSERKVAA